MKKIFLTLAFLLSCSICPADMPHVLKNGDIVDANQLNENFEHLELLSLSDAKSGGIYPTYANDVLIGNSIIFTWFTAGSYALLMFNPDFKRVPITKTGAIGDLELLHDYSPNVSTQSAWVSFANRDCTGDKYVEFSGYPLAEGLFLTHPIKGRIYRFGYSDELYYYPPKPQNMVVKIPASRQKEGGDCQNIYLSSKILIPLLPNDPAVTGLPNAPFPTPITFDGIQEVIIE